MLLALAQTGSLAGDVPGNVARHVHRVAAAARAGVDVVVFPELSLTGYELEAVQREQSLRLTVDDVRLAPLRSACRATGVVAVAGAPVLVGGRLRLAALVVDAQGDVSPYAKRSLYGPERDVFEPGEHARCVDVGGVRLAIGVCADLGDEAQAEEAARLGADAWVLGVLLSSEGYVADARRAADVARRHGIAVGLANHASPTGGWRPAGGSGVWTPDGAVTATGRGEQLLPVHLERARRRASAETTF